ncbi:MAG: hypothetical protein LDL41_21485, partial [Coleofasciculus sp. S288]|nr:hypothetical protein [Coleofasciculus sp. S288]
PCEEKSFSEVTDDRGRAIAFCGVGGRCDRIYVNSSPNEWSSWLHKRSPPTRTNKKSGIE